MTLPILTKKEREIFDGLKLAEGKTGTSRTYLEIKLEQAKALCLQEDPFEAARFKWLWLAYGLEEGWLEKSRFNGERNLVRIKSFPDFSLKTNSELCKFCKINNSGCSKCELQPYTGFGCGKSLGLLAGEGRPSAHVGSGASSFD